MCSAVRNEGKEKVLLLVPNANWKRNTEKTEPGSLRRSPVTAQTAAATSAKWSLELLLEILKSFSPVQVAKYWKGCRISSFEDFRIGMDKLMGGAMMTMGFLSM